MQNCPDIAILNNGLNHGLSLSLGLRLEMSESALNHSQLELILKWQSINDWPGEGTEHRAAMAAKNKAKNSWG